MVPRQANYTSHLIHLARRLTAAEAEVSLIGGRRRSFLARKPTKVTWIPVHAAGQNGRKVTLSGRAKSRLSDKIIARRSLDVQNLQRQPIGKLESIINDSGALRVVFVLNDGAVNPGGKFLLGLMPQGIHVSVALRAAALRPEDESPQAFPGMLGEDL
jgi:hypothetical protein